MQGLNLMTSVRSLYPKQDGSLLRYEVFKIQSFNSTYSLPILPLYITDHVIFIMVFLLYELDIRINNSYV